MSTPSFANHKSTSRLLPSTAPRGDSPQPPAVEELGFVQVHEDDLPTSSDGQSDPVQDDSPSSQHAPTPPDASRLKSYNSDDYGGGGALWDGHNGGSLELVSSYDLSQKKSPFMSATMEHKPTANSEDNAREYTSIELGADAVEPTKQSELLEPIPDDKQLSLEYVNLCAFVPTSLMPPTLWDKLKGQFSKQTNAAGQRGGPPMRQILYNITGECRAGYVTAFMGPSGSGKTSFLSIVGQRAPKNVQVKGEILFNGKTLNKAVKRKIGFVTQDDVLFESLTVFETLFFAAVLRLPKDMSRAAKMERVDQVLSVLGLTKVRNTLVGGRFRRGVSGGERKRVSVGNELLINPSVMMLDEPTSGLDSTTALHLLETLHLLARGGRTIITTIHQPSSRLFQRLDHLVLFADGHLLYNGRADLTAAWFEHVGYKNPRNTNIADHILDLAMNDVPTPSFLTSKQDQTTKSFLTEVAEEYNKVRPAGFAVETDLQSIQTAANRNFRGEQDGQLVRVALPKGEAFPRTGYTGYVDELGKKGRWGAPFPEQLAVLFSRSLKTRRFEALSIDKFVQFIAVACITGLFWWQRGNTHNISAVNDIIGVLFFMMLFPTMGTMFSALFTFPQEFHMLMKERASGMYRLSAYYVARTASDLPIDFFFPTIFVLIVYLFAHLRYAAGAFFAFWATVMLMVLIGESFGLLLGGAVMNPKRAQTITTVVILTMMLVGGFFVRHIPVWISWLKYLSFIYWGFSLMCKIQFMNGTYYRDGQAIPHDQLASAANLPRDVTETGWVEAGVLLGMLALLRIAVYYVLLRKTRSA